MDIGWLFGGKLYFKNAANHCNINGCKRKFCKEKQSK